MIELLDKEKVNRTRRVELLRNNVIELAKEVSGSDPFANGDRNRSVSPVAGLSQSLTELEVNRELLEAEIRALEDATLVYGDEAETSGLLDLEVAKQAEIRGQEAQIAAILEQMAYIKSRPRLRIGESWESNPEYQHLQEELDRRQADLEELKTVVREEIRLSRIQPAKSRSSTVDSNETTGIGEAQCPT